MFHISEFDVVFLSYDEENAEKNYALLLDICPWAKRVHGVKGFDAAHRACAEEAETDWLITVDADNIVRPEFFDLSLDDFFDVKTNCLSWNGLNAMNGLSYGNGGLKLWRKTFLQTMACHEYSSDPKKSVDFCWENGYKNILRTYSDVYNNLFLAEAFQAVSEDAEATRYRQRGVAALLAKSEGLTQSQKNAFMEQVYARDAEAQGNQLRTAQGTQARGI